MAKQSLRVQCLTDWLKDRNPFKGLSKPKSVISQDIYNPNIKIKGL